jgi:hypothetical protein
MRPWPLLLALAACGGTAAPAVTTTSTTLTVDHLGAAPEDVDDHLHAPPVYVADLDRLYVETTSDGDHADTLRASAKSALDTVPNMVSVDDGGDVELHVELAKLAPGSDGTACSIKVFVMRLPQHDLLAIADGAGRATGTTPADVCISTVGTAIVQSKLPPLLQRQLASKR